MQIIKYILLFILLAPFSATAKDDDIIELVEEKIKNSLISENALSFTNNSSNIKLQIDKNKLKNLPKDIKKIGQVNLEQINKKAGSFKGAILILDNDDLESLPISGRYTEIVAIPSFKSRMPAGYIIEKTDIENINIDAKLISHSIISNESELIGKTPKYTITAHSPIKKSAISDPLIINKKDLVTAVFEKDAIKIRMVGVAIDSGSIGDTIRIKNTKSNAILHGIIMNNNLVKIQ